MEIEYNWLAIAAGAIVAMISGALWYGNALFGKTWQKQAGLTEKKLKEGEMRGMLVAILRSFVLSFALFHIIYVTAAFYTDKSFLTNAVGVGLWVAIGIVAITMAMHDIFDQRPKMLTKIHVGFELVTIPAVAIAIGVIAG